MDFNVNVSDLKFVAWDTETTGIVPGKDFIVEIAAVMFDEEFEHRRFETLVKPPKPIPPEVIAIHGINDEMVAGAPAFDEVAVQFFDFLNWCGQPRVLIAHNASFDIGMVYGEKFKLGSTDSAPDIVLDSCMFAKAILTQIPKHSMESLAKHFEVPLEGHHRAINDVVALKEVFLRLLGIAVEKVTQGGGAFTLEKLIDLCGGYYLFDPKNSKAKDSFRLAPRLQTLDELCGTDHRVAIVYGLEEDYRYITPQNIKLKGFKVYIEAFCHRDQIVKTFLAERILKIGRIE